LYHNIVGLYNRFNFIVIIDGFPLQKSTFLILYQRNKKQKYVLLDLVNLSCQQHFKEGNMSESKIIEIYELIKGLIINRELRAGMQLKENDLAKKFGTSRTPIRQAFQKLKDDGFVETIPNKGTYVVDPTIEDICYAYKLRLKLEEMLSEEIIDKVTPKDIQLLEHYIDLEPKFYKKSEIFDYLENNRKFHLKIAKISDNKYLIDAIDQILNVIDIHLIFYDDFKNKDISTIDSIKEHELIIKFLKEKKLDQLKEIMVQHVKSTCEKLKQNKENSYMGENCLLL